MKRIIALGLCGGVVLTGCFWQSENGGNNGGTSTDPEEEMEGGHPDSLPPASMPQDEAAEVIQQALEAHEELSSVRIDRRYSMDDGVPMVNEPIAQQITTVEWVRGESIHIENRDEEANDLDYTPVYIDSNYKFEMNEEEWEVVEEISEEDFQQMESTIDFVSILEEMQEDFTVYTHSTYDGYVQARNILTEVDDFSDWFDQWENHVPEDIEAIIEASGVEIVESSRMEVGFSIDEDSYQVLAAWFTWRGEYEDGGETKTGYIPYDVMYSEFDEVESLDIP